MSEPEHAIRVNVDLANPGQFFACCGLLELADRLWPGADMHAAFAPATFVLSAGSPDCSLRALIDKFVQADVQQLDAHDNAASPLYLGDPFGLRLDWWIKIKIDGPNKARVDLGGGEQLKPWSGRQSVAPILRTMKGACIGVDLQSPFTEPRAVHQSKRGKAADKTIAPFYFDARRSETSLDIGFSPDAQDMSVMAYPAVESLALVGLQRFRPAVDETGAVRSFLYTAWADPLPPAVAMAAISGAIPVRSCGMFRFTTPSRGGKDYTMFSRATRERSYHV